MTLKEVNHLFPLYLYPDANAKAGGLWGDEAMAPLAASGPGGRRANLAPAFVAALTARLGLAFAPDGVGDLVATVGPEDVFHYLYALCHAPEYRSRYAEYLKLDFPRLPLTGDLDLFRALCGLGARLVALHLMQAEAPAVLSYPERGSDVVERVAYTPPTPGGEPGRIWINASQYFAGAPPEVWEFTVGGYQVCQKWLKDRKGRKDPKDRRLSYDDLTHYQRTVAALAETMRLMDEIDDVIAEHGGWPLA